VVEQRYAWCDRLEGSLSDLNPRAVNAAVNESTFREINEQLTGIGEDVGLRDVVCECARADCTSLVPVTDMEYEATRADGHHFIVSPSDEHVDENVERIVLRNERFWIVEKAGQAADVSEALDPRDP
jgi:hypothetical protein